MSDSIREAGMDVKVITTSTNIEVNKPATKKETNCALFLGKITLGLGKEKPVKNEIVRMNALFRKTFHEADDFRKGTIRVPLALRKFTVSKNSDN